MAPAPPDRSRFRSSPTAPTRTGSVQLTAALARGIGLGAVLAAAGCARAPSPLYPTLAGSIGMPHRGVLTDSAEMPAEGPGYRFLRDNDRHHALPRFAAALTRAAARVEAERPGATLVIGDLSTAYGGRLMPHLSHRSGRDADLVLYALTAEGAPVPSPGFIHYGADGLAWDEASKRFYRLDVEREWLLVKELLEDPEARIQWVFVNHVVEALLVEWARARGEPTEIVWRAEQVMLEPHPGGAHDDHVHVRTACDEDDVAHGCEPSGPVRPWLALAPASTTSVLPSDADLARELLAPLEGDARVAAGGKND